MRHYNQGDTRAQANPLTASRGVQTTAGQFTTDWLSITLPYGAQRAFFERYPWDVTQLDRGMLGYTHSGLILGSGRVCWSPERQEMGFHIRLGGRALAEVDNVVGLCEFVHEIGGHATRCDTALDSPELDIDQIRQSCAAGNFTSRFKSHKDEAYRKHTTGAPESSGRTIEFGSRFSDCFVRIYDKRLEILSRGEDDPGPLTRVEFEWKGDKADEVMGLIIRGDMATLRGIMLSYLCFRDPTEDTNKTRWPISPWWDAFMGYVERVSGYFATKDKRTFDDILAWLRLQCGPSLAMVLEVTGGDLEELTALASDGRQRWGPRHRAMMAAVPA